MFEGWLVGQLQQKLGAYIDIDRSKLRMVKLMMASLVCSAQPLWRY
jgi:hypothetical protein